MKTLAILGAGHLGQQIAHYAISDGHFDTIVFFDDVVTQNEVLGFPVLGRTADAADAYAQGKFDQALIGIGYNHLPIRQKMFESADVPFATIVHSTSWVDPSAKVEAGCVIYPGCCIDAHAVISQNSILNLGCTISHDTVVGPHSFLSPRVALAGFVKTGSRCILGINSTVIDSVEIADDVQLGGGTVVIQSLTQSGLYVGNPHRFIR